MKRMLIPVLALVLLCSSCTREGESENTVSTTEAPTVNAELLPDVYDDLSAFYEAGKIELRVPEGASEVTQIILYDEISQVQFVFDGVFYSHRAAFASTGRTGSDLTDIAEDLNYLEDAVAYTNETVAYNFEAHLLNGGCLLLWSDGEINYSLSCAGGAFEQLCAVADQIVK